MCLNLEYKKNKRKKQKKKHVINRVRDENVEI